MRDHRVAEFQDGVTRAIQATEFAGARNDSEIQISRSQPHDALVLIFETLDGLNNVYDAMGIIRGMESTVLNAQGFSRFCLAFEEDGPCSQPFSLTSYFYPELQPSPPPGSTFENDTCLPQLGGFSTCNGLGTNIDPVLDPQTVLTTVESRFPGEIDEFVPKSFNPPAATSSQFTKSVFSFGFPLKGYLNDKTSVGAQEAEYLAYMDSLQPILDDLGAPGKIEVYYSNTRLLENQFDEILATDAVFVVLAIVVVLAYMTFHFQSFFLSSLAMLHILISFTMAYFVFRVILQEEYMAFLNFLSIYVILGIGCDDAAILLDSWKQSKHVKGVNISLVTRMSWAYRRSARAMLITSLTTSVAFFATGISKIAPIRFFGVFTGILVLLNFALVCTWFPCVIIVYTQYIEGTTWKLFCTRFWICRLPKREHGPEQDTTPAVPMNVLDTAERGEQQEAESVSSFYSSYYSSEDDDEPSRQTSTPVPPSAITASAITAPAPAANNKGPNNGGEGANGKVADAVKIDSSSSFSSSSSSSSSSASSSSANNSSKGGKAKPVDDLGMAGGVFATNAGVEADGGEAHVERDENDRPTEWSPFCWNKLETPAHRGDARTIEKLFAGPFVEWTHKLRYVIFGVFLILFIVFVVVGSRLGPASEPAKFLDDDHPIQRTIDILTTGFKRQADVVKLAIVWGVAGIDRDGTDPSKPYDTGVVRWDEGFDIRSPEAQNHVLAVCAAARNGPAVLRNEVYCPMEDLRDARAAAGAPFPIPADEFEGALLAYTNSIASEVKDGVDAGFDGWRFDKKDMVGFDPGTGALRYFGVLVNTTLFVESTAKVTEPIYKEWEQFMVTWNGRGPPGMQQGVQTVGSWGRMETELELIRSTFTGFAISLSVSYAVIVLATQNIWLSTLALFGIVWVVAAMVATMVWAGWSIGIIESICLVILVGLSIDFSLHIANHFNESARKTRLEKTRESFGDLGISILSAAVTTMLSAFMMTFSQLLFFVIFGLFILLLIFFSLISSFFFLNSMLMIFGPEGDFGNLLKYKRCWKCDTEEE